MVSGHDRPLGYGDPDLLDRGPFVQSIIRSLIVERRNEQGEVERCEAIGSVVGLTGAWGSGKSSILYLVSQELRTKKKVLVAEFNPWIFSGRDDLINAFFNVLRATVKNAGLPRARCIGPALSYYQRAIQGAGSAAASALDVVSGWSFGAIFWSAVGPFLSAHVEQRFEPANRKERLEKEIHKSGCAVVVLIDDLDRVDDDEVRSVAQLIKAIADIRGISYLVAYHPKRVADALGKGEGDDRIRTGEEYLEKVIQHSIPLRPLFDYELKSLLTNWVSGYSGLSVGATERDKKLLESVAEAIASPRDIKKLAGTFSVLNAAVRDEVCQYDLLGYSWLVAKHPSLITDIMRHIERLVDDASEAEMMRRVSIPPAARAPKGFEFLGPRSKDAEPMLRLLFPQVVSDGEFLDRGTRISLRRNLLRLLYLGNPPGMISREEIQKLWNIKDICALTKELRTRRVSGALPELIARLDAFAAELPDSGDSLFWLAMARSLVRDRPWARGPDNSHQLADDACTVLIGLGLREPVSANRVRNALNALVEGGDLLFAPWLLRKHLFAHGMTRHSSMGRGELILTANETKALLEQELPRYRNAVLDGSLLRFVTSVDAIFALSNTNSWDAQLRESLTNQLNSLDAISTLASLCFPPGHSVERESLDELFDAEEVLRRINGSLGVEGLEDEWLSQCVKRLRMALQGDYPFHSS